jgi:hypothetical protein
MPPDLTPRRFYGWKYVGLVLLLAAAIVLGFLALQAPSASSAGAPAPLPTLPANPIKPTAMFMGDSSVGGAGASAPDRRWSSLVSAAVGWEESNQARPGTGYISTDEGCDGAAECTSYTEVLPEVVAAVPPIVVIGGGRGDAEQDPLDVAALVADVYEAARIGLPDARIIAVGPWTGEPAPTDSTLALDAAVRAAADSVGASYVSLIAPMAVTPSMVSEDDDEQVLNDTGHSAIAGRVLAALGRNG